MLRWPDLTFPPINLYNAPAQPRLENAMDISYEKHGAEAIENLLTYLAASEPDAIEDDDFEVIGEDEQGREGSADISIVQLAGEAEKCIKSLRERVAKLEQWQRDMVAKAADSDLTGYRQLGQAAARAEGERDEYRSHLAAIAEMTGNKGDIGAAHEGVNALTEDLGRHKRMFAAACETLGEIQRALGNDIVGCEPALVKELIEDRDALAAHVERLTRYAKEARLCLDHARVFISTRQKMHECGRDAHDECLACLTQTLEDAPTTSLNSRDLIKQVEGARIVAERAWKRHNFLNLGSSERERAANHATLVANELFQKAEGGARSNPDSDPHPDCELECGAYGTYCKCNAEARQ